MTQNKHISGQEPVQTGEKAEATPKRGYHWNYADYRTQLRKKRRGTNLRDKRGIYIVLTVLVLILVAVLLIVFWQVRRIGTMESKLALLSTDDDNAATENKTTFIMNDTQYLQRLNGAVLFLTDGQKRAFYGCGILLDNGYLIADLTSIAQGGTYVVDEEGTLIGCKVMVTDTENGLALLLPDETVAGCSVSYSTDVTLGESVSLFGYYLTDLSHPVMEKHTVSYINGKGSFRIPTETVSDMICMAGIFNESGTLVGICPSDHNAHTLDSVTKMVQEVQDQLNQEQSLVDEYQQVDFLTETTYADVEYEESELYHVPRGVKILTVDEDSNAAAVGLLQGDIIYMVNQTSVKNAKEFEDAIHSITEPFYTALLFRNGSYYSLKISIGEP